MNGLVATRKGKRLACQDPANLRSFCAIAVLGWTSLMALRNFLHYISMLRVLRVGKARHLNLALGHMCSKQWKRITIWQPGTLQTLCQKSPHRTNCLIGSAHQ